MATSMCRGRLWIRPSQLRVKSCWQHAGQRSGLARSRMGLMPCKPSGGRIIRLYHTTQYDQAFSAHYMSYYDSSSPSRCTWRGMHLVIDQAIMLSRVQLCDLLYAYNWLSFDIPNIGYTPARMCILCKNPAWAMSMALCEGAPDCFAHADSQLIASLYRQMYDTHVSV